MIRKIILNKFQFQPQSVLNLFLFLGGDFNLSVLIKFVLIKKKSVVILNVTVSNAHLAEITFSH